MLKTITFAIMHFSVAFTVAYLLTGSLVVGGAVALVVGDDLHAAVRDVLHHDDLAREVTQRNGR